MARTVTLRLASKTVLALVGVGSIWILRTVFPWWLLLVCSAGVLLLVRDAVSTYRAVQAGERPGR